MTAELAPPLCRGYRGPSYDRAPHVVAAGVSFYEGKRRCADCYRAYADDWRAGRGIAARASGAWARRPVVLDGAAALRTVVERAGFASIPAAVAAHTVFLSPETVAQTGGSALFPVIRVRGGRRGTVGAAPDGRPVMFDDNTVPTDAFLWSAGRSNGPDVQFNHVWSRPYDPEIYTALWNVCATPAFLAKTTDGSNHPDVQAALRYHAFWAFRCAPAGEPVPIEPPGYGDLVWAPFPPPIVDLEGELRRRLAASRESWAARACREIGWLFSDWKPDPRI